MTGGDQLDLELPPRSHRQDPNTSRRAEAEAPRGRQARAVLDLLRHYPGRSSSELAELARGDVYAAEPHRRLYQIRRRLSDLRLAHLATRRDEGGRETKWWPTDEGLRALGGVPW